MNREQLIDLLKNNVCSVTFTKVDGTTRRMECTLKDEFLPEAYRGKGTVLTEGGSSISVMETATNQWKAFRIDSVLKVEIANDNFGAGLAAEGTPQLLV